MNFFSHLRALWKVGITQNSIDSEDPDPLLEMHPDQRKLAHNLLSVFNTPISEVMTPRADIDWIDLEQPWHKVQKYVLKSSHNTFPACRHDLDKIVGKVSLKKILLSESNPKDVRLEDYVEPVLFVAPSLSCADLVIKMKVSKNYMVMVVDEFGGVDGLVTLSDISERMIGEIDLDQLSEVSPLKKHKDGTMTVDGRMTMEDFERNAPPLLLKNKSEADTVGGLVLEIAGRIPARGELIKHVSGITFEVLSCDERRIKKLRVHHVDEALKTIEVS